MKKRIIIGLAAYTVVFLAVCLYIIFTIERGASRLDRIIELHQVEILREHFLIQVKQVQVDLALRNTRHAGQFDTVVRNFLKMKKVSEVCFECHHNTDTKARLMDLQDATLRYQDHLSRVITLRAGSDRVVAEEDAAFRAGLELTDKVGRMVALTNAKLNESTNRGLREISAFKNVLYAMLVAGPVLSIGLAAAFILGFTRPMDKLLEATRALQSGNLDFKVEGLKDEFGELGGSFNEMSASLKGQMHKMRRAEQMAIVGQLAAGFAHEVKNPMAGIKVAMSVLSGESSIQPEDREVLRKVMGEITRLEGLMKDFLNFAKPQKPSLEPVNLNQVLNTTLAFYLKSHSIGTGEEGKVRIVKDFGDIPPVLADVSQLQQVFLNLFLNALDAMPDGGTLSVKSRQEEGGGKVRIEIADTGKGMRKELLDKIFEPFFTTKSKGTGLGLAITRQMVEQHEGTIEVSNRPEGGALFAMVFPAIVAWEGGA
ncbi:MAG: HAMP domain-containing protein [Deltaproteobacteria bacterium]|nr:HAMP domain-containing protein [Deltaproteobacteria bacterium]